MIGQISPRPRARAGPASPDGGPDRSSGYRRHCRSTAVPAPTRHTSDGPSAGSGGLPCAAAAARSRAVPGIGRRGPGPDQPPISPPPCRKTADSGHCLPGQVLLVLGATRVARYKHSTASAQIPSSLDTAPGRRRGTTDRIRRRRRSGRRASLIAGCKPRFSRSARRAKMRPASAQPTSCATGLGGDVSSALPARSRHSAGSSSTASDSRRMARCRSSMRSDTTALN